MSSVAKPAPTRTGAPVSRRELLSGVAIGGVATSLLGPQSLAADEPNRKLLLGGGGIKGAYQAGMIMALLNQGFVPNVIYGVSVGALNGAFLVDRAFFLGKAKAEYYAAFKKRVPQNIDGTSRVDWPFLGEQLVLFWKERITSSSSIMRKRPAWTLAAIFNRFSGLYDASPLRSLIKSTLDPTRMRTAGVPLGVFAVNLDSWQGEYFFEKDPQFLEAIIASAAIPVLMPIVDLNGPNGKVPYVDGGLRQTLPVAIALAGTGKKKPTHLVSLVCQSPKQPLEEVERGNMVHLLQRYADIAAEEMLKSDIQLIQLSGVKSIILQPADAVNLDEFDKEPFELDDFSSDQVEYLTRKGFADATEKLVAPSSRFVEDGFRAT